MIFGHKRKIPDLNISSYGCQLERVKVFKFLGVWMDKKLSWKYQVEKIIHKCEKVGAPSGSVGRAGAPYTEAMSLPQWTERDTILMIYQATIRLVFDYGCVIFGSAAKTVLSKLVQV